MGSPFAPLGIVVALAGAFLCDPKYREGKTPTGAISAWLPNRSRRVLRRASDDERIHSIGVEIHVAGDGPPEPMRDDYRRLLGFLLDLADRLGARVHDGQLGGYVERGSAERSVDAFA